MTPKSTRTKSDLVFVLGRKGSEKWLLGRSRGLSFWTSGTTSHAPHLHLMPSTSEDFALCQFSQVCARFLRKSKFSQNVLVSGWPEVLRARSAGVQCTLYSMVLAFVLRKLEMEKKLKKSQVLEIPIDIGMLECLLGAPGCSFSGSLKFETHTLFRKRAPI